MSSKSRIFSRPKSHSPMPIKARSHAAEPSIKKSRPSISKVKPQDGHLHDTKKSKENDNSTYGPKPTLSPDSSPGSYLNGEPTWEESMVCTK